MAQATHPDQPPSYVHRFMVGRDAHGRWVVCDETGSVGGLFTDRAAAVHFAMFESDYVPGAVFCAPDDTILSLAPVFDPTQTPVSRQAVPK